jgi:hypothetical protein
VALGSPETSLGVGHIPTTREKGRKPRANSEAWSRQGFDFEIACAGVVG